MKKGIGLTVFLVAIFYVIPLTAIADNATEKENFTLWESAPGIVIWPLCEP